MGCDEETKLCGLYPTQLCFYACYLGFIAAAIWFIWNGEMLIAENEEAFEHSIVANCTVYYRAEEECSYVADTTNDVNDDSTHRRYEKSKLYDYEATSPACPNITLKSAENHQECGEDNVKNAKSVGEIPHLCYIESCDSAEFIFEYYEDLNGGATFVSIGIFLIIFCVLCMCIANIAYIIQCVKYLRAIDWKKKLTKSKPLSPSFKKVDIDDHVELEVPLSPKTKQPDEKEVAGNGGSTVDMDTITDDHE